MKWSIPFAVAYIIYAFSFAIMFRYSNLCYVSDDPQVPQPFLAYGFHSEPATNAGLETFFSPFTHCLNPNDMILDPGEFSGANGSRLGWAMPFLLWQSSTGKFALLLLAASLGIVAIAAFPTVIRFCLASLRSRRHVLPTAG